MLYLPNWIFIGGTGRNIGKTTLAEMLVKKLSAAAPVTALKIARINPKEMPFHGHAVVSHGPKIIVREEQQRNGNKDSMRFLQAGATRSWYVQTEDQYFQEGFTKIRPLLENAVYGVCESNALRRYVRPALFIMVAGDSDGQHKKNISDLLLRADITLKALHRESFEMLVKKN
jgi:2-hydroxy-3-keto-5-methylthiopentenyl-1-phosphate phosphatase